MIQLPATTQHHLHNIEHGRRATTRGIVIHVNEGYFQGTIDWFASGSGGELLGAHLEIGDRQVAQLADLDAVCWHAGAANGFAIGFEHKGFGRTREEWLTAGHELTYSANRAAWCLHQYNLGPPRYGHNIWPHSWGGADWGGHPDCPGHAFPWDIWLPSCADAYYGHWGRRHA
jgi:hypothetical protein